MDTWVCTHACVCGLEGVWVCGCDGAWVWGWVHRQTEKEHTVDAHNQTQPNTDNARRTHTNIVRTQTDSLDAPLKHTYER